MKLVLALLAVAVVATLGPSPTGARPAAAHVCLDYPVSRVGAECTARSPQKIGSCPVERTQQVNVFRPGETITVRLRETVNHPSHYRIAFNPDGDTFEDPTSITDINPNRQFVLVDGITDEDPAIQEIQITFPRITCENCTLQLIQVMHDKQGNGFGGANGGPNDNDDMYYTCADIALRGEPVPAPSAELPADERRSPLTGIMAVVLAGVLGGSAITLRKGRGR